MKKPTDRQALYKAEGVFGTTVDFDCGCRARIGQTRTHWDRCESHRDQVLVATLPNGATRIVAKGKNIDRHKDGTVSVVEVIRPLRRTALSPRVVHKT